MSQISLQADRFTQGVAIVAGGSGGLGGKICATLARMGCDVALTYHSNAKRAAEVVVEIEGLGRRGHAAAVDLTDPMAVAGFVDDCARTFGGVHSAVYAAGPYITLGMLQDLPPALVKNTMTTDIFGCFNFLHAVLTPLRQSKGAIVALTTPAIKRFAPTDMLSSAPKAAIEQFVKGIAHENGGQGIRANCVGVGFIDDGMVLRMKADASLTEEHAAAYIASLPIQRIGSGQDVANAVAFLLSDLSSYTTGHTVTVDGGYSV